MRLVVVDLEMCQPSCRIIQIGAVCFEPDSGKVVDTFDLLVNPGEVISDEIIALTRITNERVANAPDIVGAAQQFTDWKKTYQINPIGVTWGAGLYNDISLIYHESKLESPFDKRIIDTKAVYNMLANSSNAAMRGKVGLGKAIMNVGLKWNHTFGAPHDALADAWNTYFMYMFLSKCMKQGFEASKIWRLS